jgi:hypothetical protein
VSAQDQDPEARDRALARKGRTVSLVIAGTMIGWLVAQSVGALIGLPGRYAILFDLLALAGLFWGFVVSLQIWRARKTVRAGS